MIRRECEGTVKISGHENVTSNERQIRAIAAFSGGLDSILAALLVRRCGIDVTLLHVQHLFSADERGRARIRAVAERVGLPLRIVDASEEHLEVVRTPKHGYGRGMNPCIDCRIFTLKAAKRVMEELEAEFVITGEVLGQRPKSQHRRALLQAEEESGLGERLLRPLSANLLPDSLPVKQGWLRKDDLLAIEGRSRDVQMKLAEELGVEDYPQPAGGCLLIERPYAARVRDAFEHRGRENVDLEGFRLLKLGRQFRLSPGTKVIVGRNEWENEALAGFADGRIRIEPVDVMGPTSLIEADGDVPDVEVHQAAALAARYCDAEEDARVVFEVTAGGRSRRVEVEPLSPDDPRIVDWRIE